MNDLIDRQAVVDALEKVAELYPWRVPGDRDSYSSYNEAWQDALNRVENEIEALPSVQSDFDIITKIDKAYDDGYKQGYLQGKADYERKKGKWIDAVIPNDNGGLPVQVCDQCNTFFSLAYTGGGHSFCPNCGADMRGDRDED